MIMVYWRVGDSEEWDELGKCLSRGSRSCRIESVFENGECLESAWRVLGECVREWRMCSRIESA